jgi:RimJ/RimL family protein N-acetyltransferase
MLPGQVVYRGKTKKGLDIVVRYPIMDDVVLLQNYINTLSKECTFIRLQGEQLTLEEENKYLEKYLKDIEENKAVKLFVFTGEKLIAVTDIHPGEKIERHVGTFGITVASEYRNQGIGKLLTHLVLDEAIKYLKEIRVIRLGVFANNPIAKIMYEKFGFVEYGSLPEGIKHKDKYVGHIYMYKKIR